MKGKEIVNVFEALKTNRATLDTQLQDIQRFVVPFRGEFFNDTSIEQSQDWFRVNYYDTTASVSANLLASQMMGNVTSPINQWFEIQFRGNELDDDQPANEWLESVNNIAWQTVQQSNFDTAAPEMYLDTASFGTAIMTMEDVDDLTWKGVTFNTMPLMDCYFQAGPDGLPYLIVRLLRYTQNELENTFDLPDSLKEKNVKDKDVTPDVDVLYCVYKEPANSMKKPILAPKLRPTQFRYVHRSTGKELKKKGMASPEGGFYDYPGMTIRWQKVAGARWGYSPALTMMSNIRQLNTMQYMMSEAWAKAIDPPMKATELAVVGDLDNIPGGLTITTDVNALQPLYPATNFNVGWEGIDRAQQQVREGFFVDKLELPDQRQMTAYEVQVRYERMLRLLAPTLGRLKTDFLMPVVMGIYYRLERMKQLPEMPESVMDAELDIEFTGPLPRAMKGEIGDQMERWLMGIIQQSQDPRLGANLDIVDFDAYNIEMAKMRGVPAKTIRDEDDVTAIRESRAEQEKAMQQTALMQEAGKAAQEVGKGGEAMQQAGMEQEA